MLNLFYLMDLIVLMKSMILQYLQVWALVQLLKFLKIPPSLKKLIEETKKFKNNPDVYKELKRDEELKSTISKFSQEDKDIFINLVQRSFKV